MDFSKINRHDMDQFMSEHSDAYHFLLGRILRNEWRSYACKLYAGSSLNTYESGRFSDLTKAKVYDVDDIPMLDMVKKYVK